MQPLKSFSCHLLFTQQNATHDVKVIFNGYLYYIFIFLKPSWNHSFPAVKGLSWPKEICDYLILLLLLVCLLGLLH